MLLNDLSPAPGAKTAKKRLGRGIGSGLGKTSGRGHKGQKARAGGTIKPGFEGGQMPIQRRLPKFGFTSRKSLFSAEVKLSELKNVAGDEVTLESLKDSGVVRKNVKTARIVLSGEVNRALSVKGIKVTKGAAQAIQAAGGKVEE